MKKAASLVKADRPTRVRRLPRRDPASATVRAENSCKTCSRLTHETIEIGTPVGLFQVPLCGRCRNRLRIAGEILKKIGESK